VSSRSVSVALTRNTGNGSMRSSESGTIEHVLDYRHDWRVRRRIELRRLSELTRDVRL